MAALRLPNTRLHGRVALDFRQVLRVRVAAVVNQPFAKAADGVAWHAYFGVIGRANVSANVALEEPQAAVVFPGAEVDRMAHEMI